jgi:hypothetical protein
MRPLYTGACRTCISVLIALLSGAGVSAQLVDHVVTDRPALAEGAETVPPGRFQLEAGYTFARSGTEREHSVGELLLRLGAGPNLEARLGLNSYVRTRTPEGRDAGLEDMSLGLKARVAGGDGRWRPDAALVLETTVPTGGSAHRVRRLQPAALLCLEWPLSERAALLSNLGYSSAWADDERFSRVSGSLSLAYDLSDRWAAYLELYRLMPAVAGGPDAEYVHAGVVYHVRDGLEVDLRGGRGLGGPRAYFWGAGAVHRW